MVQYNYPAGSLLTHHRGLEIEMKETEHSNPPWLTEGAASYHHAVRRLSSLKWTPPISVFKTLISNPHLTKLIPSLDRSQFTFWPQARYFSSSKDDDGSEDDDEDEIEETSDGEGNATLESTREYSPEEKEAEAAAIGYKIGSHQFKVSNGDCIFTERLKFCEVNDKLILNKVLLLGSATQTIIGRPIVPHAAVCAAVEEHALDAKVIIFKKKRRKNYRRTKGHRQELTKLRITDIQGIEKPEPKAEGKKPLKLATEVREAHGCCLGRDVTRAVYCNKWLSMIQCILVCPMRLNFTCQVGTGYGDGLVEACFALPRAGVKFCVLVVLVHLFVFSNLDGGISLNTLLPRYNFFQVQTKLQFVALHWKLNLIKFSQPVIPHVENLDPIPIPLEYLQQGKQFLKTVKSLSPKFQKKVGWCIMHV
ncbi:hypothetical protein SLEP1_g57577 [Rubroshorea leprosula]|uniref:Large ribosomal subunit protein bL21m n=1 Tax=Rubroshorea leprosula TaxID=152421 RepID=A0AAV5MLV2_9ROSI|nr:hypothetical protein SLEP1_g57577 [Rubroshorea leprosula]